MIDAATDEVNALIEAGDAKRAKDAVTAFDKAGKKLVSDTEKEARQLERDAQPFGGRLSKQVAELNKAQKNELDSLLKDAKKALDHAVKEGEPLVAPSLLAPPATALGRNYPNPFNPETWIPFQLSREADVFITIYDLGGRVVRRLELGRRSAGFHTSRHRAAYWDGRSDQGERVGSGAYVVEFRVGDFRQLRRVAVLK